MTGSGASRYAFLSAVALVAAAIADPAVETISNTGIFGGHYADHNRLSVVPTAIVGIAIALQLLVRRALRALGDRDPRADTLLDLARDFSSRRALADVPFVLGAQLVALFVMEHAEQAIVGDPSPATFAWLGGPVAFALAAHALVGIGALFAARGAMRAALRTVSTFFRLVLGLVWSRAVRMPVARRCRRVETPFFSLRAPHVRQTGGRAPPAILRTARAR